MSSWNIRCNILKYNNGYYTALLVHELSNEFTIKKYSDFRHSVTGRDYTTIGNPIFERDYLKLRAGSISFIWIFKPDQIFEEEQLKQTLNKFDLNYDPYIVLCPYIVTEEFMRFASKSGLTNNELVAKLFLESHPDLQENYISYI